MKKILIVFNHPAPYKVRLFNELSKAFDVHVIFERDSESNRNKGFYFEEKFNFTTHQVRGIKFGDEGFVSSAVKNHIKKNNYDLIIMNGYSHHAERFAISYMKKNNIPYVLYINGGRIKEESSFKKNYKRKFISGAKAYFSPDEESNRYLVYYGADKNKILNYPYSTIYENEILTNAPDKTKLREELQISFDKVFVSAGQLIERKNYLSLVKEWENMPEKYGFFLIGDGEQRSEIEKVIAEKHLKNIVLLGFLSREKMFKYFQASDAFLFPSNEDIYGHVINEALSQGIPAISTNKVNSAIKLIRNGVNGYLLDSLEGDSLSKAINETLKVATFDNCIKVAKENTIEKMAAQHIEMINEVIGK